MDDFTHNSPLGGKRYQSSQPPLKRKLPPKNIEEIQEPIGGEIGTFKPRWKASEQARR
jgi:hypothetical protein